MADPITFVLKAMPEFLHEAHDASTRRSLTKLNALFFKIKVETGEFTEKDFQKAQQYYAKIETVALISQNQMMLDSLKDGMALLKTTLIVKNLLDKNTEIEPSNVDIADPQRPAFDALEVGDAIIETSVETPGFADDEVSLDSSLPLEIPSALATDRRLANFKALERPAIWCLAAVMPPLLFVPKIRHRC